MYYLKPLQVRNPLSKPRISSASTRAKQLAEQDIFANGFPVVGVRLGKRAKGRNRAWWDDVEARSPVQEGQRLRRM